MLRISKLADYGTMVLAHLAQHPDQSHNAKSIAGKTRLQLPTVSKILKILAQQSLVTSQRGVLGGYRLAQPASQISLAQIIQAMDGGIALTTCGHGTGLCHVQDVCTIQHNWLVISQSIHDALSAVSLADVLKPLSKQTIKASLW